MFDAVARDGVFNFLKRLVAAFWAKDAIERAGDFVARVASKDPSTEVLDAHTVGSDEFETHLEDDVLHGVIGGDGGDARFEFDVFVVFVGARRGVGFVLDARAHLTARGEEIGGAFRLFFELFRNLVVVVVRGVFSSRRFLGGAPFLLGGDARALGALLSSHPRRATDGGLPLVFTVVIILSLGDVILRRRHLRRRLSQRALLLLVSRPSRFRLGAFPLRRRVHLRRLLFLHRHVPHLRQQLSLQLFLLFIHIVQLFPLLRVRHVIPSRLLFETMRRLRVRPRRRRLRVQMLHPVTPLLQIIRQRD